MKYNLTNRQKSFSRISENTNNSSSVVAQRRSLCKVLIESCQTQKVILLTRNHIYPPYFVEGTKNIKLLAKTYETLAAA